MTDPVNENTPITADSPFDFLITEPETAPKAVLMLAHGSGTPMDSPFMERMASMLASHGIVVARFEFSYMARRRIDGKRRPAGRAERWTHHYFRAVDELLEGDKWKAEWNELPFLIGGKSMGGRVAAMLASDEDLNLAVRGVVVLGYPFHPSRKSEPENWRLEPLQKSLLPILICQGERDDFGWWDEVNALELPGQVTLEWITDGSHDLGPTGKSESTMKSNMEHAAQLAAAFAENPPKLLMEFGNDDDDEADERDGI
ncbi:alpha/beta family hydrolase [Cohaesibacter celericrescens]|uniref:alpha/beta family hydrolase n=1 Tax=Cohaesibacter celericrescens TaxID=2067669 RepID=UPI0015E14E58|nr:alpha/beta family hydrolase [Cohaesibacter celericrescens]